MDRRGAAPLLLLAALAALAPGCRRSDAPILIGAPAPWHLDFLRYGQLGVRLAVAEINREGGIDGRPLVVVFRNDSADAERAATIATAFTADPEVLAVLGHANSGALLAAARIYDGRLAAVSPTAVAPELRGISRWVFRLMPNDSVFGIALGVHATRLGNRAAVLYDNTAYGRGTMHAFRQNYRGAIVSYDPIQSGDTALEPFVSFYRANRVNLVYVAGVGTSGLAFLRAAARQRFRVTTLGTDTWQTVVAGDTAAAEGTYVATRFSVLEPRPEVAAFVRTFRDVYGEPPDGLAAFFYDATRLLGRALREGGTTRRAVRQWLAELEGAGAVPGVTGPLAFTRDGDPVSNGFTMLRVQGGRLVLVNEPRGPAAAVP
jgi:branched-chain amino acid transport system substrate-binding protein